MEKYFLDLLRVCLKTIAFQMMEQELSCQLIIMKFLIDKNKLMALLPKIK